MQHVRVGGIKLGATALTRVPHNTIIMHRELKASGALTVPPGKHNLCRQGGARGGAAAVTAA